MAASVATAQKEPDAEGLQIRDIDRDSLHILPLSIIPLETPGLRRARMVKNAHLDSVVELFSYEGSGSGQVKIGALGQVFNSITSSDYASLHKLSKLSSYDVYSLRITLRQLGIPVNDHSALKLSQSKQQELNDYMKGFTQQLIFHVYGNGNDMRTYADAIDLFKHPDVRRARENLRQMAERLGTMLEEVPRFLEDFGDTYLSISYYQHCLRLIEPSIIDFLGVLQEIQQHRQLKDDHNLVRTCDRIQANIKKLVGVVKGRFGDFDQSTNDMWGDLSSGRFKAVRSLIRNNHTTLGGLLCTLTVKMNAWNDKFPHRQSGGPLKWADFVVTDMKQGLDRM